MKEKCVNAYRIKGKNYVFCKNAKGDFPACGHAYMCPNTKRWEANGNAECSLRNKPTVNR